MVREAVITSSVVAGIVAGCLLLAPEIGRLGAESPSLPSWAQNEFAEVDLATALGHAARERTA